MNTAPFTFDYQPGALHYGRGCVADVGDALADRGLSRALVVTGSNVAGNDELMGAVDDGLGDALVEVFAGTTPDKRVREAVRVADRADDVDADVLVPVGGGSSLDVATVASVLRARGADLDDVRAEVRDTGGIALPDDRGALTPTAPVPTTLAGADLSVIAGITVDLGDDVVSTSVGGAELMPASLWYDPALFETTPESVLAGSAMNGFDKALESLYSRHRTVVTDATAEHAVNYLVDGLPDMFDSKRAMDRAVAGVVLAQYGISRPGHMTINVVHAFGHGLRDAFGVQQGLAHAAVAPTVVRDLLDSDADTDRLLAAFDVDEAADAVAEIERVRDELGLPGRLRDVDGVTEDGLAAAAAATADDSLLDNAPDGYALDADAALALLRQAW